MPHNPSIFQVFRWWRQWEDMGAGKTHHNCIFACLLLTHHPCCLRAWNRLHSSKIHKTLIMQKCPNRQRELKYQEFLHPVGKKLNTHPCTTISYALSPWEKKPFCNPWGHCCGWTNEIRCFNLELSLEKVWHCLQQPIWTYSKDLCSLRKTSRIYPCPTIIRFILTRKTYRIHTIDYSRLHVNCLKTVLVTAADTYMAHTWQYQHPPPVEYFLPLSACWSLRS